MMIMVRADKRTSCDTYTQLRKEVQQKLRSTHFPDACHNERHHRRLHDPLQLFPTLENNSTNTQARRGGKGTDDALEDKLRGSAKPQDSPEYLATSALLPNRSHAFSSVDHVPT